MEKICLFTAHSPLGGGGSVILRSLISALPEFSVSWLYISEQPAVGYENGYMGSGIMGGSPLKDIVRTYKMLANKNSPRIDEIVQRLLKEDCEAYWIVSHNEGLKVALELAKLKTGRPVHLTVHDDWEGALVARSYRYRFFGKLALALTRKTLQAVNSFDVVSLGMKTYYMDLYGLEGSICHRYLHPESISSQQLVINDEEIKVGHIGSIYDKADLFRFLYLMKEYANENNRAFSLHMWGHHIPEKVIPPDLVGNIVFHGNLPEEQAIKELLNCAFVYAMYPMSRKTIRFSKTSLPTKLTTYLQCGRPIFGHSPAQSTLVQFLNDTGTGVAWDSEDTSAGIDKIRQILSLNLSKDTFEGARRLYFGENNLLAMRKALGVS